MQYDNNNTGALFRNDKGDNPKRPDYRGNATIDGTDYKISAWERQSKNDGSTFLSVKFELKDEQQPQPRQQQDRPQQQQPSKPLPSGGPDEESEDIPF